MIVKPLKCRSRNIEVGLGAPQKVSGGRGLKETSMGNGGGLSIRIRKTLVWTASSETDPGFCLPAQGRGNAILRIKQRKHFIKGYLQHGDKVALHEMGGWGGGVDGGMHKLYDDLDLHYSTLLSTATCCADAYWGNPFNTGYRIQDFLKLS